MTKEQGKIADNQPPEELVEMESKLWGHIRNMTEGVQDDQFATCGGYTINRGFFLDNTIAVIADINLPESDITNPKKVDLFMEEAIKRTNEEVEESEMDKSRSNPYLSRLEKDPVFGIAPKIPKTLSYYIHPHQEHEEEE